MQKKAQYLVSACLCGIPCRYDGKSSPDGMVQRLVERGKAIPVCPEVLGGMPIPRAGVEITCGDGSNVIDGSASVISKKGDDLSPFLLKGAYASLRIAKKFNVKKALLKKRSPSCGCGLIKRSRRIVKGDGVTTALFKREGIKVISR